jgi:hypothetical protein
METYSNAVTIVGALLAAGAAFSKFDSSSDPAIIFLLYIATLCFIVAVVMARVLHMCAREKPLHQIPFLANSKTGRWLVVNEYRLIEFFVILSAVIVTLGIGVLPWVFVVQLYRIGGAWFHAAVAICRTLWAILLASTVLGLLLWGNIHYSSWNKVHRR